MLSCVVRPSVLIPSLQVGPAGGPSTRAPGGLFLHNRELWLTSAVLPHPACENFLTTAACSCAPLWFLVLTSSHCCGDVGGQVVTRVISVGSFEQKAPVVLSSSALQSGGIPFLGSPAGTLKCKVPAGQHFPKQLLRSQVPGGAPCRKSTIRGSLPSGFSS